MNAAQAGPPANPSRRQFFQAAGLLSTAALAPEIPGSSHPAAFSALKPLTDRVHPITPEEFRARIEHAQRLMAEPPLAPTGSPPQAAKPHASFCAPLTSLHDYTSS